MSFNSVSKRMTPLRRINLTPWFYYDVYEQRCKGKRNGRCIHSPSPELKKVQRAILRYFFKDKIELNSVKDAASVHCGKKWLLKLDILDFYNSVSEEQIKKVITDCVSDDKSNFCVQRTKAGCINEIFSLCTVFGSLPTGAPTSPYIANILLKEFDGAIEEFCRKFGVTYSRYMDDLFFSTNKEQYYLSIVELEAVKLLKELGFSVNADKIKYISSNKCQMVLGLCVNNKKPVLTKEEKRKYRAYFYNLIYPIQYSKINRYEEHERELFGHLAYIKSVDEDYYKRITAYIYNLIKRCRLMSRPCLKALVKTVSEK